MKNRTIKKNKKSVICLLVMLLTLSMLAGCGSVGGEQEDKKDDSKAVEYKDIGSWEKTKKKAEADKKKHKVEFKITKVITDQDKIAKELENYNNSGRGNTIDTAPGNDDLEYPIVNYKVKFPEDFPDSDFGLTDVTIGFKVTGLDGKEEIKANEKVYKKLSKIIEIGDLPQGYDFYASG